MFQLLSIILFHSSNILPPKPGYSSESTNEDSRNLELWIEQGGLVQLIWCIKHSTDSSIVEFAIWMLSVVIYAVPTYFSLLVELLSVNDMVPSTRRKLYFTIAAMLRKSEGSYETTNSMKLLFKELGGINKIVEFLKKQSQLKEIPDDSEAKLMLYSAAYLLGESVFNVEENIAYLQEQLPLTSLASLFESLNIYLDYPLLCLFLEISCFGGIRRALANGSDVDKKFWQSKEVEDRVNNIIHPKAIHSKRLKCSRSESLTLSSLSLSLKEHHHDQEDSRSSVSSRHSSFSEVSDLQADSHSEYIQDDETFSRETIRHSMESIISWSSGASGNNPVSGQPNRPFTRRGVGANHSPYSTIKAANPSHPTASSSPQRKLTLIRFRSKDSARMFLELLSVASSASMRSGTLASAKPNLVFFVNFLLQLFDANPINKKLFCAAQGTEVV